MFGTVHPRLFELKPPDRSVYTNAYRDVCLHLGSMSLPAKCCLMHDAVLMAALVDPGRYARRSCGSRSCFARPRRRDPLSTFAAYASLLMAKTWTDDQIRDTGRWRYRAAAWAIRRAVRAATAHLGKAGFPIASVQEQIEAHLRMERQGAHRPIREWAQATAECYRLLYTHAAKAVGSDHDLLAAVGYHVGTLTYLVDAARDLDSDRQQGQFNPLADEGTAAGLTAAMDETVAALRDISARLDAGGLLRAALDRIEAAAPCRQKASPLSLLWQSARDAFARRASDKLSPSTLYCIPVVVCDSDDCGNCVCGCIILCCLCSHCSS